MRVKLFLITLLLFATPLTMCLGYKEYLADAEDDHVLGFISHCNATGEWGKSYGPAIALDAVHYTEGAEGLLLTATDGVTDDVRVYRDINPAVWDLSDSTVSLDFYIDNVTSLNSIVFRFWNVALSGNYYINTVTLFQTNFVDGWNTISLARSNMVLTGVVDWSQIRRFSVDVLAQAGETVCVTLDNIRIISPLGGGCVTIRFDDGDTTLYNASVYMAAHGFAGVAAVITSTIPATNNGFIVGLDELNAMSSRGWDIISHLNSAGVTLHSLSLAQAETELKTSRTWLRSHGFTDGSRFLATPEHRYTQATLTLINQYYLGCMTLASGHQTTPPHDTHRLTVRAVHNTTSVATIEGWIDSAMLNDEWLILLFHKLDNAPDATTEYDPDDFDDILQYLEDNTVPVVTLSTVYDQLNPASLTPNQSILESASYMIQIVPIIALFGVFSLGKGSVLDSPALKVVILIVVVVAVAVLF